MNREQGGAFLGPDELVVAERPWLQDLQRLGGTLRFKRYGK